MLHLEDKMSKIDDYRLDTFEKSLSAFMIAR